MRKAAQLKEPDATLIKEHPIVQLARKPELLAPVQEMIEHYLQRCGENIGPQQVKMAAHMGLQMGLIAGYLEGHRPYDEMMQRAREALKASGYTPS
jgi:hypothetical protein